MTREETEKKLAQAQAEYQRLPHEQVRIAQEHQQALKELRDAHQKRIEAEEAKTRETKQALDSQLSQLKQQRNERRQESLKQLQSQIAEQVQALNNSRPARPTDSPPPEKVASAPVIHTHQEIITNKILDDLDTYDKVTTLVSIIKNGELPVPVPAVAMATSPLNMGLIQVIQQGGIGAISAVNAGIQEVVRAASEGITSPPGGGSPSAASTGWLASASVEFQPSDFDLCPQCHQYRSRCTCR
ncbi:MAG: hypothetical protein IT438_00500 [Phycisphaerales bacterium]|nr:hypothetical protein [Phycisphaerales bacterium]